MTPTTVDLPPRYRDARHLANGGMAAVYAAEDALLGRRVAIKLLAAHFAQDPAAVRRFQREARAAARVSQHPHVVTIYDVGGHEGLPFIVMQLMDGGSLARVLRTGPPPREDALRWISEAASALDAANGQGIVHRDVKPGNLLLDARGRLGVADFGIARLAYESAVTLTGQVLGTAAYIAPEQASGEGATAASDRYSLAVVAHELLTGGRPGPGGPAPDLPPAAAAVLARGLARDPRARWPTAAAFAQALFAAAEEPETEATRALGETGEGTARTFPLPSPRTGGRRPAASRSPLPPLAGRAKGRGRAARRWLPVALVVMLVALLGVFALAAGGGDEPRDGAPSEPATKRPTGPAARKTTPVAPAPASQPSVAQLNDQGFALMNQGRYGEAIPLLQRAVDRCGESRETACAYALYNLGRSLRLAGRPTEAIPILERRLTYDDQTGGVQAELDAARREAGQITAPPPVEEGGDKGPGRGKGKGKGKKGSD